MELLGGNRRQVLERIARERRAAADAGESRRVAELDALAARLGASSTPSAPAKETTGATSRPRQTTGTTPARGQSARRTPEGRTTHVTG